VSASGSAAPINGREAPFEVPPWPVFAEDEIAAVERVLRSGRVNYWTGDEGRRFEAEYASYVGVRHAVAVANGTVALEVALRALGVGPGDEVVVPSRTFIATASPVVAVGARPVVADVDRDSQCLTPATVEACLSPATRAVIPVHHGGWPCDMDGIMELAGARGLKVVEDCAQAHGARWRGRPVGSFGHVAAFSFCQDKIVTTCGEGGMVVTDDEGLWRRVWEYKDHGKDHDLAVAPRTDGSHGFKWLHSTFGSNLRMTEVQAAVGRIQLRKLDGWVDARRRNAAEIDRVLCGVRGVRLVTPAEHARHSFYRYYLFVVPGELAPGWTRDAVIEALNSEGVRCGIGTCPEIYRERAFIDAGLGPAAGNPVAEEVGETSIALLTHPSMSAGVAAEMAGLVVDVLKRATAGVDLP
jgi:dTDP-4-amino-4,6-dideoxygalactose transaminase